MDLHQKISVFNEFVFGGAETIHSENSIKIGSSGLTDHLMSKMVLACGVLGLRIRVSSGCSSMDIEIREATLTNPAIQMSRFDCVYRPMIRDLIDDAGDTDGH